MLADGEVDENGLVVGLTYATSIPTTVTDNMDDTACEDGDGVDAVIEDAGPNGGDGNFDGIPDSIQSNVATILDATGTTYVTLEARLNGNGDCTSINRMVIEQETDQTFVDSNYDYPYGLVDFTLTCDNANEGAEVKFFWYGLSSLASLDSYRKFGPPLPDGIGAYADYSVTQAIESINSNNVFTVTYDLTDNLAGDETSTPSTIIDPTGPAVASSTVDPCDAVASGNPDNDNDGISDICDEDDDNDGILDTDECGAPYVSLNALTELSVTTPGDYIAGDRLIKTAALVYLGNTYDAIIDIITVDTSGGGSISLSGSGTLRVSNGFANTNPYFTYELAFVPTGTVTDGSPFTPSTVGNFSLVLGDIDGSNTTGVTLRDVAGYNTVNETPYSVVVGADLLNEGFVHGTTGINGPGATAYNYYRKTGASGTQAGNNGGNDPVAQALVSVTLTYTSYTVNGFVFGVTGAVDPNDPFNNRLQSHEVTSFSGCDTDSDGITDIFDTDSDGDACSDANENYASVVDTNGDGTFGGVVDAYDALNPTNSTGVDVDGTVNAASYTTTNIADVTVFGPDADFDGISDACDAEFNDCLLYTSPSPRDA